MTPRETEVLELMCGGCTRLQIARVLGRKPATIASHQRVLYELHHVHSDVALVAKVLNARIARLEAAVAAQ